MRATRERIVFYTSAVLSGLATMALAAAATSTAPVEGHSYRVHPRNWSDAFCAPDDCTRVAKTPLGGPPSTLY